MIQVPAPLVLKPKKTLAGTNPSTPRLLSRNIVAEIAQQHLTVEARRRWCGALAKACEVWVSFREASEGDRSPKKE
jgi:hypothetical protein